MSFCFCVDFYERARINDALCFELGYAICDDEPQCFADLQHFCERFESSLYYREQFSERILVRIAERSSNAISNVKLAAQRMLLKHSIEPSFAFSRALVLRFFVRICLSRG